VAAGAVAEARWTVPCAEARGTDEIELVLSLDGGLTFPIRISPEMSRCASGYRWRVPALPTTHARLALRMGSKGRSETERLELVSEEFAILSDSSAPPEELFRGTTEWWTRQALTELSAEDALSGSIQGDSDRLIGRDAVPDASEPSAPSSFVPQPLARRLPQCPVAASSRASRFAEPNFAAPIPQRE
jgi:hypothetical protein